MARSKFFHISSGSLGNLVFYSRNGKTYVRTKPMVVTNPKTPAQQAQRQRMKLMMDFLRKFTGLIRITYAPVARREKIPFHVAMSYNVKNAIAGEFPNLTIDKGKVLLSQGPLPISTPFSLKLHPEGFLIEWEDGYEGTLSSTDDMLLVIVLMGDHPACSYLFTEATRYSRKYLWKTKEPISPGALPDVWVAFSNCWMTQMSNSRKLEWE